MTVTLHSYALTHRGRDRTRNEDQYLIADLRKVLHIDRTTLPTEDGRWLMGADERWLFLVADGLSGQEGGEQASQIATAAVAQYVLHSIPWCWMLRPGDTEDLKDELRAAMERAHRRVRSLQDEVEGEPHMATSLTMAFVLWPRLFVVHAGHTLAFLSRGRHVERITTDHTVARQLAQEGVIPEERAEDPANRWSHVLWNTLGGDEEDLVAEARSVRLVPGDRLLLCSDGVTRHLETGEIQSILQESVSVEDACAALLRAAYDAGGSDNITALVVDFRDAA